MDYVKGAQFDLEHPDGLPETITTYNDGGATTVVNSYAYNQRRLLTSESSAQPGWYTFTAGYGYDGNGSLASLTYPGGLVVDYAPNALGQPTKAGTFAANASYWPNGAIRQFTYGNGIVHTLTRNARGLPEESRDAYGASNILQDVYDYDAAGNVAAISDGATGQAQRGNRTMTYDGLDRLTDVASPMYGTAGAHYTYDVLDNLTRTIAVNRDQRLCYDTTTNQLTNVKVNGDCSTGATILGLGYDPQGNLANWNGVEYAFDYGNRLRSVEGLEAYRYDGHGRRVLATSLQGLGNLLSMYSQAGQLLYQHDVRSNQRREYVFLQGSLVAERSRPLTGSTATVTYQHTDALGTPVAKTNASRVVVQRSEYEPYGKLLNRPLENGPGYTGHVTDAATQLTYMQQRYYDPRVGRFWSVDPVTASANTGANFNRYKYAANNPYKFIDPDGRYECQGSAGSCAVVDRAVAAVNDALSKLEPGTSEHSKLSAVSQALGQKGDKGITFKPQALKGRVFARAGKNGLIRVDTGKIERGLASYNVANPHMQSGQVSDALGGRAVTHETQHQIDYKKQGLGYPASRDTATLIERSAYASQAAFDQAAGLNSDLWNPHMSPEARAQKIENAASRSVDNMWSDR